MVSEKGMEKELLGYGNSYMLLIFKATKCAIEGFTLLMQYMYLFSPCMAAQLKRNRTVNVHGRGGRNISADLFMEHLNRECKGILSGMYSNVTENSVLRVSHALKPLTCAMLFLIRKMEYHMIQDYITGNLVPMTRRK